MNPIEEQRKLIDQLYHLVHKSSQDGFDTATCRFDYFVAEDDGSSSIGTKLSYIKAGETKYGRLSYPEDEILYEVIPQLHSAMKAHTGGDWQAFVLTINQDGSVTTKFEYPEDDSFT